MMVKWGCKAEAPPKLRLTQTEDILMRNHFKEQIKLFERNFAANYYENFKKLRQTDAPAFLAILCLTTEKHRLIPA